MSTSVKYFDSTMSGAPSLSNTAGTLIGVLDACLVDGFGSVTVNSLVVAADVATVTVSAGHQFAMIGNTGPVIRIAGASPSGLNGDWRVTVTGSTTFIFATTGISDQTATGTISAKRAPAGFSKIFSGTNKAVYRSDDVTGTQLYCWINDSTTTNARIRGYESMTDVDTGTGPFPTDAQISGGGYVYKGTGTNRPWTLFSDGRLIYFFCDSSANSSWYGGFVFGDINSYVGTDPFGCVIISSGSSSVALPFYQFASTSSAYLARAYTQLGTSLLSARYSHGRSSALGGGGQTYPAPADNRIHLWPVDCWDGTSAARGLMPGLWNPVHNSDIPQGLIVDDIPQLPGNTLLAQITATYSCALDIAGPWR